MNVFDNKAGWVEEMELGEPDASGRRCPIEKKGGVDGHIGVESEKTGRTTRKGVFAGRDAGMASDKYLADGEWWDPDAPKPVAAGLTRDGRSGGELTSPRTASSVSPDSTPLFRDAP